MTAHASEPFMLAVIDIRGRHIWQRCVCWRDIGQCSRATVEFVDGTLLRVRLFNVSARSLCESRECVALLTGFSPEQMFGLGGVFRYPLRGSEDANRGRQRLTCEVTARIAQDPHIGWVRRNVFPVSPNQKCMNDFRLVVRNAKVEPFVEREQVARRTGICKLHWRHQLAATNGTRGPQSLGMKRQELVCICVANGRSAVLRIVVSQVRIRSPNPLAIPAFELTLRTTQSPTNRPHLTS